MTSAPCTWPPCPQVEFGAHQVVLTRSMESMSKERLPEALRNVNALKLTVPQSKGGRGSHACCAALRCALLCWAGLG